MKLWKCHIYKGDDGDNARTICGYHLNWFSIDNCQCFGWRRYITCSCTPGGYKVKPVLSNVV